MAKLTSQRQTQQALVATRIRMLSEVTCCPYFSSSPAPKTQPSTHYLMYP